MFTTLINPDMTPLEPNGRRILYTLYRHLVSDQGPNVTDSVSDHRGSFQPDTPSVDVDVLRESHRFQHFRSEHSTVPNLHPFIQ